LACLDVDSVPLVASISAYAGLLCTGYELDPLAKRPKGDLDVVRRLPVMRLSMVVQRLLDMERRNSKAAAEVRNDALRSCWTQVQKISGQNNFGCGHSMQSALYITGNSLMQHLPRTCPVAV
jgi:hypothetical protein